jgi:hypothetical protein
MRGMSRRVEGGSYAGSRPRYSRVMVSTMLMYVGLLLVVSGGTAIALHHSVAARVARVLRRRPVALTSILREGFLRMDGRIAAGAQGTLVAPCSSDAVVWFRLRARRRVVHGNGEHGLLTVADEQCGTLFHVDDGSGAAVEVDAGPANVVTTAVGFRELPDGAHARVGTFLEGRGSEVWMADLYEEECLRPGDPVMVAGFARREPGGSVPHLYRDVPSTKLVVDAAAGHELVLATPDAARRAVGGAYRGGSLAVLIGVAMAGAGLLTQCWGP